MAGRARTGGRVVVWFAAANFTVLLVAVLAALATGALDLERLGAAAGVIGGGSEAVPVGELEALKEARAKLEGQSDEAVIVKATAGLTAKRAAFEAWKARESSTLRELAHLAKRDREAAEKAWSALASEKEAELIREERDAQARRQNALDKVKRVYRYMRPVEVARDLEARLESGRAEEVAELLRAMNDRAAAEALEAIADPASRMRIYDALAGTARGADRP